MSIPAQRTMHGRRVFRFCYLNKLSVLINFFATKCAKITTQILNPDKPEITNYKHQNTNNFQISKKIKNQLFGILNFGHCYLFDICVLLFEIFAAEN
jgi:hypothetical protein